MKKAFLALSVVALALGSCQKEPAQESKHETNSNVEKFTDLKVPEGFDWSATHTVHITLKGSESKTGTETLQILNEKGQLMVRQEVDLSKDLDTQIYLPKSTSKVTLKVGDMEKQVEIEGGTDRLTLDYE